MKKFVSLALAFALTLSLAACGGSASSAAPSAGSAPAGEKKELTIWVEKVFSDEANTYMEERIKAFEAETGVAVTYEMIAATDFVTKLNAAIEAGSGVPDVVSADTTKVLNYYPNIPCVDVSDLVSEINEERPYFTSSYEGTKIGDAHYYVPFCSSSTVMYVRKDKLAEKGITEMPTTWEEVFEAAAKVTDPANDFYGLGMGCGETDDDDENTYRQWLWNEGGSLFDKDGNVTAADGKFAELLNKYQKLYKDGVIPPDATTWDAGGNNGSYLAGRTAIVFNAPTLYNALRNNEENKELFENTAVLAPPVGSDNGVYMGFNRGFAIMNTCTDVDTASSFIKYLLDKAWYDEYFTYTAPVFAPLFEDELENPTWTEDEVNAQVLKYAQNASGYYGYPVATIEGRAVAAKHYFNFPMVKAMNQVATGSETAENAIKATASLIDDLKDQVGG